MNLRRKIAFLAVCPVVAAVTVAVSVLVYQQRKLDGEIQKSIRSQALSEAAKVAHDVRLLCLDTAAQTQERLIQNLGVARDMLDREGGASLGREKVVWNAVNQLTGAASAVELPRFLIGGRWLGMSADPSAKALVVDDILRLTQNSCTIFQRMNDAGDMLRVATTNLEKDGSSRALGTFIPAVGAEGAPNEIVRRVLAGETYCGRAFVVNQWRTSIYEPLWDSEKKRVVGMLSVGYGMESVYRRLRESIAQMTVGKTGYIFVLGSEGAEKGRYIVSYKNERNGENIWDSKDSEGRFFIQSIVEKGRRAQASGALDYDEYYWKNPNDPEPRKKLVAIVSYPPWNWVIGASVYEEDFSDIRGPMVQAKREMLLWVSCSSAVVALLAMGVAYLVSRRLAGKLQSVASELDGSAASAAAVSSEITETSKAVADGASEQASALEETSASLEQMSAVTKQNAERADSVEKSAKEARAGAEQGAAHMRELKQAVEAIHGSSSEITKVIKTIDEIAFQTNILALNAAVEAARAGESGAGFAVVAEEVRALAQRSASAARETALLINEASGRSQRGLALTEEVAVQFEQILERIRAVGMQMDEIASASREQSSGIEQIKKAVQQLDGLTQANAVHADRNATVSANLKEGTLALRDAINRLGSIVDGQASSGSSPVSEKPARI